MLFTILLFLFFVVILSLLQRISALRHENKMLINLLGKINHDVRSTSSGIRLLARQMTNKVNDDEMKEYLQLIHSASRDLSEKLGDSAKRGTLHVINTHH